MCFNVLTLKSLVLLLLPILFKESIQTFKFTLLQFPGHVSVNVQCCLNVFMPESILNPELFTAKRWQRLKIA